MPSASTRRSNRVVMSDDLQSLRTLWRTTIDYHYYFVRDYSGLSGILPVLSSRTQLEMGNMEVV